MHHCGTQLHILELCGEYIRKLSRNLVESELFVLGLCYFAEEQEGHLKDPLVGVHVRQEHVKPFLEEAVLAHSFALFFLEHFQTQVDRFHLVLFLAGEHHHVESWVEEDNVFLSDRLLVV